MFIRFDTLNLVVAMGRAGPTSEFIAQLVLKGQARLDPRAQSYFFNFSFLNFFFDFFMSPRA